MNKSFKEYYLEAKEKIEKRIESYNEELIKNDNEYVREYLSLFKELNSGGKLIRGVLAYLGYGLLKDDPDYAISLSLAYEVFQTAILIHDDIIDNDNKRRGKDTVHYACNNKYKKYSNNREEVKHLSESIAICTGNYGLFESNKIIANDYQDDPNLGKILKCFNDVQTLTVEGELIDTILPFMGKHNSMNYSKIEENIMTIYRLKTSYYTITGPLSIGIILAGGNEYQLSDIEKFGEKVGIAFQIQDDILGVFGDSHVTGKPNTSDVEEFKQTILYSHIINTEYKDEFLKYYGKESISEKDMLKVQDLLRKSNSLEYAENMMNNLYDESLNILQSITWLNNDKKELLKGFVEYLRTRNK